MEDREIVELIEADGLTTIEADAGAIDKIKDTVEAGEESPITGSGQPGRAERLPLRSASSRSRITEAEPMSDTGRH